MNPGEYYARKANGKLICLLIGMLACWQPSVQADQQTVPAAPASAAPVAPASAAPAPPPSPLPSASAPEQSLGRISDISVDGNTYTREDVVRQAAGLTLGEQLSVARINWALDNMARRRLWAGFTLLTRPGPQPGTSEVRLRVLERQPFPAFLPGTTALIPSYDGLALREENMLGGGQSVTFRGRWLGARIARLDVTEPHLLGTSFFMELTGFWYKNDKRDLRLNFAPFLLYDERKIGGDLVLGTHLSANDRIGVDLRATQEDAWVVFGAQPERHEPVRSINAFYIHDTRSSIYSASYGQVVRLGGEFHLPINGAPPAYQRYSVDVAQYVPLFGQHQLAVRAFGGLSRGPVPFYDLWRMGGISNSDLYEYDPWGHFGLWGSILRAFQEGATSGENAVNATLEYRFPLYQLDLWEQPFKFGGVAFFDVAHAWRSGQAFDWGAVRWSLGAGLRLISPFGTLRGDFGYHPDSLAFWFGMEQVF